MNNVLFFEGINNCQIAYSYLQRKNSRGCVLILPGLMETLLKYHYWINFLLNKNYDVIILDHRGMGLSGRLDSNHGKVHLDSFDYYVDDINILLDTIHDDFQSNFHILAHSTGALIASYFLAQNKYNAKSATFTSPLFQINSSAKGIPYLIAKSIGKITNLIGLERNYVMGFDDESFKNRTIEKAHVTHDFESYEDDRKILTEFPQAQSCGPTFGWTHKIISATEGLEEVLPKIRCPVTIFQAELDSYVENSAQNKLVPLINNFTLIKAPGSYHEILMEIPQIKSYVEKHLNSLLSD